MSTPYDTTTHQTDVKVVNHGSLWQFYLLTEAAQGWWAEYVPDDGFQVSGTVKVVEPRYAVDLVDGMVSNGLVVR
jgi:hypothetical protein